MLAGIVIAGLLLLILALKIAKGMIRIFLIIIVLLFMGVGALFNDNDTPASVETTM